MLLPLEQYALILSIIYIFLNDTEDAFTCAFEVDVWADLMSSYSITSDKTWLILSKSFSLREEIDSSCKGLLVGIYNLSRATLRILM